MAGAEGVIRPASVAAWEWSFEGTLDPVHLTMNTVHVCAY